MIILLIDRALENSHKMVYNKFPNNGKVFF